MRRCATIEHFIFAFYLCLLLLHACRCLFVAVPSCSAYTAPHAISTPCVAYTAYSVLLFCLCDIVPAWCCLCLAVTLFMTRARARARASPSCRRAPIVWRIYQYRRGKEKKRKKRIWFFVVGLNIFRVRLRRSPHLRFLPLPLHTTHPLKQGKTACLRGGRGSHRLSTLPPHHTHTPPPSPHTHV